MLSISWTERKTNILVRDKAEVTEEGLVCFIKRREEKRRELTKSAHWKRRPESLVPSNFQKENYQEKTEEVDKNGLN